MDTKGLVKKVRDGFAGLDGGKLVQSVSLSRMPHPDDVYVQDIRELCNAVETLATLADGPIAFSPTPMAPESQTPDESR